MRDHRTYLKVKVNSLAAEAAIIRREERKASKRRNTPLKVGLSEHRRGIVRFEARHSQLAYGFLRGMPYERIESKCSIKPRWSKIRKMIDKYGIQRDWSHESRTDWDKRFNEQMEAFKKWSGE